MEGAAQSEPSPMEIDGASSSNFPLLQNVLALDETFRRELQRELECVRGKGGASDRNKRGVLETFLRRAEAAGTSSSHANGGRRERSRLPSPGPTGVRARVTRFSTRTLARSNSRPGVSDAGDDRAAAPVTAELQELAQRSLVRSILGDATLSSRMERYVVRAAERFSTDPTHVYARVQRVPRERVPRTAGVMPAGASTTRASSRSPPLQADSVRMTVSVTEQVRGEVHVLSSWRRVSQMLASDFRGSLEAHIARRVQRVRTALRHGTGVAAWATMMDRYYGQEDAITGSMRAGANAFEDAVAQHDGGEGGFAASLRRREGRPEHVMRGGGQQFRSMWADTDVRRVQDDATLSSLRTSVERLQEQVAELRRVMAVSVDLQLDTHLYVRQEVAAAIARAQLQGSCDNAQAWGVHGAAGQHRHVAGTSASACVVCLEQNSDTLLYGCGHLCVCTPCGRTLKAERRNCPVCRAPIRDAVRVFTS
eukprot:Opistho-1_new@105438